MPNNNLFLSTLIDIYVFRSWSENIYQSKRNATVCRVLNPNLAKERDNFNHSRQLFTSSFCPSFSSINSRCFAVVGFSFKWVTIKTKMHVCILYVRARRTIKIELPDVSANQEKNPLEEIFSYKIICIGLEKMQDSKVRKLSKYQRWAEDILILYIYIYIYNISIY